MQIETQIDMLKTVGLLGIILAHVETPNWIFQLRTFDVPLFVFVSGILFGIHQLNRPFELRKYLTHRALRILLPVWLFLLMYFLLVAVWARFAGQEYPYSFQSVLLEFLLISRVIGTWIFRVFLIIAMLSPLLLIMHKKKFSNTRFMLVLTSSFVVYHFVATGLQSYSEELWYKVFENTVLEAFPYFLLFGFGMIIRELSKDIRLRMVLAIGLILIAAASVLVMTDKTLILQAYKYPPFAYYILYGSFWSLVLFELSNHLNIQSRTFVRLFKFLGRGSLWIYLWHWWYLYLLTRIAESYEFQASFSNKWVMVFLVVFSISSLTFLAQQSIINLLLSKYPESRSAIGHYFLNSLSR